MIHFRGLQLVVTGSSGCFSGCWWSRFAMHSLLLMSDRCQCPTRKCLGESPLSGLVSYTRSMSHRGSLSRSCNCSLHGLHPYLDAAAGLEQPHSAPYSHTKVCICSCSVPSGHHVDGVHIHITPAGECDELARCAAPTACPDRGSGMCQHRPWILRVPQY